MHRCRWLVVFALVNLALLSAARAPHIVRGQAASVLTLTPASGPAGTAVSISGFAEGVSAADAAAPSQASRSAFVCWDACPGGLSFEAVAVRWSKDDPGAYALTFGVPATPWLEVDGLHQPSPGTYTVGVQCLTPPGTKLVGGCATKPAIATASFTLTGDTPPACATPNCTTLQLSPADATPGTLVTVSGSAPLAQHVINQTACCWDLMLETSEGTPAEVTPLKQSSDGTLSGSFRAPLALPDAGPLAAGAYVFALRTSIDGDTGGAANGTALLSTPTLAITASGPTIAEALLSGATFTLDAAPPWSSLTATQPLATTRSTPLTGPVVTNDDGTPQREAVCVEGSTATSTDGGATWSTISTAGARQTIVDAGFTPFPDRQAAGEPDPACLAILLDAAHPDSIFATFQVSKPPYGAPPIINLGLVSTDAGATWHLVPPPDGAAADGFGGFFSAPAGIEALFSATGSENLPLVEATDDGGQTWTPEALDCPASGPCVRWGAAANTLGSCAMHEYPQPLLISSDGGQSFGVPTWPASANGCETNEVVALSPTSVLLLRGRDPFPAVISNDGGATWQALALPALPGAPLYDTGFNDLHMLPSGALLASGESGSSLPMGILPAGQADVWYLLPPGATAWCAVDSALLPGNAAGVQVVGMQVWVFPPIDGSALPAAIDAGSLTCGST